MAGRDSTINICFHGIGEPGRELEAGEDRYWISSERYRAIVEEIASWPSVAVSFDDGNASDADIGLEPLLAHGLTATFFVLAGRLDQFGSLSTSQVRTLVREGMTIGSHGMDHQPWTSLDAAARPRELVEARAVLADAAERPIDEAACPLGRYDRSVLRDLETLGYSRVHTSDRRSARASSWIQPRYSVRREDTPASLRAGILERQGFVHRIRPFVSSTIKRYR